MVNNRSIGVIVPAYNEGKLITKTLTTMPNFVDTIIVINDCSVDDTQNRIDECIANDDRIILLKHEVNQGLGQTLIDGYIKAKELKLDVTAVMAGDAQMDPDDLINVVTPITLGEADYVKGQRLLNKVTKDHMPKYRFIGNNILTILTKFATGYWHCVDPQCGYTAISLKAISSIPIQEMIKGYGYNAHILFMLNMDNYVVKDVQVKAVYGEEKSKIKLAKYVKTVSALLIKLFFKRISTKYLVQDFNPLALFYGSALICLPLGIVFLIRMIFIFFSSWIMPSTTLILFTFTAIMGFQSLFFAMWMDMQDNKRYRSE